MKLGAWLDQQNLSQSAFSRSIGVRPATINRYVLGKRLPDHYVMQLIMTATGGAVTPKDFYESSPALKKKTRKAAGRVKRKR